MQMEKKDGILQVQNEEWEKMDEELMDALSLVILLENDMEVQEPDGIHARVLKMVHHLMKDVQKKLSALDMQTAGQASGL